MDKLKEFAKIGSNIKVASAEAGPMITRAYQATVVESPRIQLREYHYWWKMNKTKMDQAVFG